MLDFFGLVGAVAGYSLVVAVFAVGIAFWLSTAPRIDSIRKRATIAGALASSILTLVPMVVVATQIWGTELIIVVVTLLALGAFLAAVAGFPAAYFASRRFDRNRVSESSGDA